MAEISKDLIRGHTDAIVLNILAQGDSYGYRIVQDIRSMSDNQYELNEATLYTVFRRLQKDELVTPYYGDETQGGRRKYYAITDRGHEVLRTAQADWQIAKPIIDHLVSGKVVEA
ncbi:PadR family transcriptional regulator [Weissella muntiaci]|jgi:PadR family transcriptional regulator, regulatory protein PadR|uniref:PadR family transcriptional regulator n=1 Tax=Weissella muntiaci TaxID=2508881 RepID=A0A6C2C4S3_9LACO|nr:PadR family transcriptional regulator [Weissella muntiaci]TYC48970.1 PadR family transcriptional regulator [Weissella muntiaci]